MNHQYDQTYSLADLRSYCLANNHMAEAERLELYMALQRAQRRTEDLATHVGVTPSFVVLPTSA